MKPAVLVLEDGEVFEGEAFGSTDDALGEVVFNTSMTGYQEVLTDPSYDGQIVTMTYPHVGNYGTNDLDVESSRPRVAGFVIRDLPPRWSSWRGRGSLEEYLNQWEISGITEIDTRRLTRHIRERGAMRGVLSCSETDRTKLIERARAIPNMSGSDLTRHVSTADSYSWIADEERFRVSAYDFGMKFNILRQLNLRGCSVKVFPSTAPSEALLADDPDGIFLSNGPGDPEAVGQGIEAVRSLIGKKPMFGICLGHQLMGLALGLPTYKLRFGHRGINHPVARLADGAIEITTQNHGFAVGESAFGFDPPAHPGEALPSGAEANSPFGKVELTHINLNDYTIEGFLLRDEPAFAVQYHPEAGPGPHDARYLFDDFTRLMED